MAGRENRSAWNASSCPGKRGLNMTARLRNLAHRTAKPSMTILDKSTC